LAKEIGISRLYAVGNKVEDNAEADWLRSSLPGIDFLGFLPDSPAVRRAVRTASGISDAELGTRAKSILQALEQRAG